MTEIPPDPDQPPNLFDRAGEIFLAVRDLPIASRDEAIDRACAGNWELRNIVLLLMRGNDAPLPVESLADDIRAAREEGPTLDSVVSVAASDRIGNYKLLERIGEGGFGIVFMADQERPVRRRVALKIIKLGMDTKQVVARFEAERQALALMDHPNIARVFDAGATDTGRPYFVMELVKGQPITEFCDAHKLPIAKRLGLISQVCDALHHAHQRGVIHRDIKPSNVLVTGTVEAPVCKVIDFGIAKATSSRLTEKTIFTEFRQMIGTPEYMSPEQAGESNQDVDTRTDIYATGVLLYELLTGSTPFDSKRLRSAAFGEMQRIIREEDPPKPSTKLSTASATLATVAERRSVTSGKLETAIKGELDWIVMKAIDKDRTRRYDSAGSMAADLQRYLSGHAIEAAPPNATYRVQKFVRRHRIAVTFAASMLALLVVGLIGTSYGMFRALDAERGERIERGKAEDARSAEKQQREIAEKRSIESEWESYVANIGAANSAAATGETARGLACLAACPAHLRGWEWRYLSSHFDSSLHTYAAANYPGTSTADVDCSPDGAWLVTPWNGDGSRGGWGARIAARATFAEHRILRGHDNRVVSARFSPDGTRVVTASADATARVFEIESGKTVSVMRGHTEALRCAVFSSDGRTVITVASDLSVRTWDAASGAQLTNFVGGATPYSAVPIPGSSHLLLAQGFDEPRILDPAANALIPTQLPKPVQYEGLSVLAAPSADGKSIAAALKREYIRIFDLDSGRGGVAMWGHWRLITSLRFSPDGTRLFSASHDGTARMWETATGEQLSLFAGHLGPVVAAALNPDASRLYTASEDGTVREWDASVFPARSFVQNLSEHSFNSIRFSPDGTRFVTSSYDGFVRVWDAATCRPITEHSGADRGVTRAIFTPDGLRVISCDHTNTAHVFDAATGETIHVLAADGATVNAVAVSPSGTRIAAACSDNKVRLWNSNSGELIATMPTRKPAATLAFSRDSSALLAPTDDAGMQRWNAADGAVLPDGTSGTGGSRFIEFAPNGWMLTGGENGVSSVWEVTSDAASGRRLALLKGHGGPIFDGGFTADSSRVATTGRDGTVRVWDSASGRELLTLRPRTAFLYSVAFRPNGETLIVSGDSPLLQLFNAPGTGSAFPPQSAPAGTSDTPPSPPGTRHPSDT